MFGWNTLSSLGLVSESWPESLSSSINPFIGDMGVSSGVEGDIGLSSGVEGEVVRLSGDVDSIPEIWE